MEEVYIVKFQGRTVLKTTDSRKVERWGGPSVRKFTIPANNAAR